VMLCLVVLVLACTDENAREKAEIAKEGGWKLSDFTSSKARGEV
jgi:hypothetical protein